MKKRNGKLTKKEIVKRMYFKAHYGMTGSKHSLSYLARRIDLSVEDAVRFLKGLNRVGVIQIARFGRSSVEFK